MRYSYITGKFDKWIDGCYDKIRRRIINTHAAVDEDAFQNTYLALHDAIAPEDMDENKDFTSIFLHAYRLMHYREYTIENMYTHPDPLFFMFLTDETDDYVEESRGIRQQDVLEYAKRNLGRFDYTIFNLAFISRMSQQDVAECTGRSVKAVALRVKNIRDQIRGHFTKQEKYNNLKTEPV